MSDFFSMLPKADQDFVREKSLAVDVVRSASGLDVIFRGFDLPAAYSPRRVDLLIKLPVGYPAANPDMFWTNPDVRLANGAYPIAADVHDATANGWQRWSRHGGWRPGVDNLRTKLAAVIVEFETGNQ